MAAKDYKLLEACFGIYLAKETKTPNVMSADRRLITDSEIVRMAHWYLRKELEKIKRDNPNASNTIVVLGNDKPLFEMTLIDKQDE